MITYDEESGENLANTSRKQVTSFSSVSDFTQSKAINGKDSKDNFLEYSEQEELIIDMYNRLYSIKVDGKKELIYSLGDGRIQNIERTYKNFKVMMKFFYGQDLIDRAGFMSINLEKLFELVKNKDLYSFRESRSIFHARNEFIINEEKHELISNIKIDYNFEIDKIPLSERMEIIKGINEHWKGHLSIVLDHLVASKYVTDKKNVWLMIMADSNFGKSKIFKWIEKFGGSAFIDFKDLVGGGISDKSPDEFEGKLCLVIDEVTSFHRNLFKIEDYLTVRPMRQHSVQIPINSRILLSADGGTFNNEYMDKQIINRVAVIDFRGESSKDLGDLHVSKKYGKYKIQTTMTHYLHAELKSRLEHYESLSSIDKANYADEKISNIFEQFKQKKADFFEMVERSIYEILDNPLDTLDENFKKVFMNGVVAIETNKFSGHIVKRPQDVLMKLLGHYDKTLEYELNFKTITQIETKIKGFRLGAFKIDGKSVRGLYIPSKVKVIFEDKNGNLEKEFDKKMDEVYGKKELF